MALDRKNVVITGATRGLGLALVREFVCAGWQTTGVGRSARPEEYPEGADFERFDASDIHACRHFWEKHVKRSEEGADGLALINNAGVYVPGGFLDPPAALFEESIRCNYLSAVNMTRTLFDIVTSARLVNIVSTSALQAKSTNSAYGSAKAGMAQFFRSLQQEFSPEQYRIINVYPGTIRTHGEGPDVDAIEPEDLSMFVRELLAAGPSFYVAEATLMPKTGS